MSLEFGILNRKELRQTADKTRIDDWRAIDNAA